MSVTLLLFKHSIPIGVMLALIPLMVAVYFLQSRLNAGELFIKLSFMLAGLIVFYLLFKIILKYIHKEEKDRDLNTKYLIVNSLFSGAIGKKILQSLGLITGILLLSFLPAPWNVLLILTVFYVMFTMLMRLA